MNGILLDTKYCLSKVYLVLNESIQKLEGEEIHITVKILKFGTPQTIAIIVLKIEKFDVTLH